MPDPPPDSRVAPRAPRSAARAAAAAPPPPPVQFLKGVGPARARLLGTLGIRTPLELLHSYPRAHEDRRRVTEVARLAEGETAVVRGVVRRVAFQRIRGRRSVVRVTVDDGTGVLEAEWW